ncbi:MAG TPA: RelA/SpoT domain-containing protein [Alphaproteobacteria bacterium]|nr:RelA/SpoT domain-containing protein [Alphaproteobacteria bacterium]
MLENMDWVKPLYSRKAVRAAGAALVDTASTPEQRVDALVIVNNWRAAHNYPLNTFKVTLRRKSSEVSTESLVAQRIKRLTSIELKLSRYENMSLDRMQDLGGCRAIMPSIASVYRLTYKYIKGNLKHRLTKVDDYIDKPKESGYRGVHLVYKYNSDKENAKIYNNLCIEMQFRTVRQHQWATAVETVGTFMHQSLKSSMGNKEWLRYFALASSAIAIIERMPIVPGTPRVKRELYRELYKLHIKLSVKAMFAACKHSISLPSLEGYRKKYYFLLGLDPDKRRIQISAFDKSQPKQAQAAYDEAEKSLNPNSTKDIVLVSVDSFKALKKAYPNYFADTTAFVKTIENVLKEAGFKKGLQ